MLAFDTNVVVRLLVEDDRTQVAAAAGALEEARSSGGAWIALVVAIETVWVLSSRYRFDRAQIVSCLRDLLDADAITFEHGDRVERALAAFASGSADFSDYVVLESARDAGALPLLTFDARPARAAVARTP
ncbi:MAG: PIN domain-containing protein [Polyangiales bacterium]